VLLAGAGVAILGIARTRWPACCSRCSQAPRAAYILLSAGTGRAGRASGPGGHERGGGWSPPAIVEAGTDLVDPNPGAGRRDRPVVGDPLQLKQGAATHAPRVFGVLMSRRGGLAAMVLLSEFLTPLQWTAVVCVVAASVGATRSAEPPTEPAPN
jgi:inner membrane transporter RhtA